MVALSDYFANTIIIATQALDARRGEQFVCIHHGRSASKTTLDSVPEVLRMCVWGEGWGETSVGEI